ncbi:MAG: bifunctional 23S rRNA (guanine(2069)-N(7))-methyltransferase RlmK/23S rRNA (guanine(2445)-N(2))-methyltransferase RlmL [Collinsella sp.]|nr:bifunctional 23S rRNA (guanine(2069)-N(7))-methyltransferase RlmK/23S rRNA (guanine(2445)-N(2))-methyltransferase RlmL [Collinsella sp.]
MTRHRGHRPSEQPAFEFFATCPEGFEGALANELRGLRLARVRPLKGRVSFAGSALDGERACLWSRLASRVLAIVARFEAVDAEELYEGAYAIPWERVLASEASVAVSARGTTDELRNSHFSALKVKDALCDRLVDERGSRPAVDTDSPDARIAVSIRGERVSVQLDLSGEALFRRLPAIATQSGAPAHVLRPDYAALVLAEAGWQRACAAPGPDEGTEDAALGALPLLIDPCCAGGGLVLEAAAILAGQAPGIGRERWGFSGWAAHDEAAWHDLVDGARAAASPAPQAKIVATDVNSTAVSFARRVLKAAGLSGRVLFTQPEAEKIMRKIALPQDGPAPVQGAIVLDTTEVPLTKMSRVLGLVSDLREELGSLGVAALTRDDLLRRSLGEAERALRVMPGNEEARILRFTPLTEDVADGEERSGAPQETAVASLDLGQGAPVPVLVPESVQFANRLKKNARLCRKWARREGVTCYRVYDSDLPDYAAAIDLYEGSAATPGRWLVIAEYAAPKSVNESLAQARMLDILAIAPVVLEVDPEHVFARTRTRSRGGSQYGRRAADDAGAQAAPAPLIEEGGLTFEVNFGSYLDTGIFLDHRVTRARLREHVRETGARRFLNLFAYTGTATCYAADAGVEETVTVDLSNTYLDWAERNMAANGFTGPEHHYVRADVMTWISEMRQTRNRWDLIFCDPPTFSNSAKMGRRTWDVQRDHVELLIGLSRLLTREGEAVFSCNLRTFRPDTEALARAGVVLTDVSAETIPEDFARNQRIHRCYLVRRYTPEEAMRCVGIDE